MVQEKRTESNAKKAPGLGERWSNVQPSKTMLFWACVASVVLTIVIGFNWGGWVTANNAARTAQSMADDAVVLRLAPICFAQFDQDPDRDLKLVEMSGQATSQRTRYIQDQGWATISGEEQPDRNVASACARLISDTFP